MDQLLITSTLICSPYWAAWGLHWPQAESGRSYDFHQSQLHEGLSNHSVSRRYLDKGLSLKI